MQYSKEFHSSCMDNEKNVELEQNSPTSTKTPTLQFSMPFIVLCVSMASLCNRVLLVSLSLTISNSEIMYLEFIKKVIQKMNEKITTDLATKLISEQFPEFSHLIIKSVEQQGHDNRTYRLGHDMLIRMPTEESYALKVPMEQALLPKIAPHVSVHIPVPIRMGVPSQSYPYPFSIYTWLEGTSINLLELDKEMFEQLAFEMANFLKELQNIRHIEGPSPGQHNWWRGDHVSVYDKGAREQIAQLSGMIDAEHAIDLWEKACKTKWDNPPVWVHGDLAVGNMLIHNGKLSAVIDFGGTCLGDPACDLVIAWTFLSEKSRRIFINQMRLDENTWLRARAWVLWKATYELCQLADKNSQEAVTQKRIINEVLYK